LARRQNQALLLDLDHAKNAKSKKFTSRKSKALAPTNSHRRESRSTKQTNGVARDSQQSRDGIKMVLGRVSRGQVIIILLMSLFYRC